MHSDPLGYEYPQFDFIFIFLIFNCFEAPSSHGF